MNLLPILADVIGPVFVMIGLGFLAGRKLGLDRRTLGRSVLYIFAPALGFDSISKTTLSGAELTSIVAFVLAATSMMGLLVWGGAKLMRTPPVRTNAILLATLLTNCGNYGIPVNLFAFGQAGMDRAVMFFVTSQFLMYTLGVFLASRGRSTLRESLMNVLRVPVFWASLAGLIVRVTGITVPAIIAKPAALAGGAAVPVLLIALGIELSRIEGVKEMPGVLTASALRLGLSIVVGFIIAAALGVDGLTRQVSIVQFAMPTAITPLTLAMEFDADPQFVTGVILVTTIGSILSLTMLLAFLK